ncbi:heme A synthase [Nocardioides sp.]|uniref:COX15/CtaA family protein n=1 Tax=Nocardioides sp. TaxID=35761 RepID=UPI0035179A82
MSLTDLDRSSDRSPMARLSDALGERIVPLAWANLVANIAIVITGGAVRLTGSGLGCPTWPQCTDGRWTTHPEQGLHGYIEFGNRMLTYVLVAIAVACWLAARARRADHPRAVRLATIVALGIPAQAIIGGITVLTDLNPWIVALHLLISMAIVAVCVRLLDHLRGPERPATPESVVRLGWALALAGAVVLYLGTVVTGSGPHAGDENSPRNGLDPQLMSHVHAWAVYVLLALTVALLWTARRRRLVVLQQAVTALLVVELLQGVLGFVQYFTDVPALLVGIHMLGAGVFAASLTAAVLATRARVAAPVKDAELVA